MMLEQLLENPDSHEQLLQAWEHQLSTNPLASALCGKSPEEKQRFLNWFRQLTLARQEQIIRSSLGITLSESAEEELSLEKELDFLKKFLFRYKMGPLDNDVFNNIGPDDFIEVYDTQGIQIYRSWNFFKFCRYTIDEVLTSQWIELYERPEFVEKKILSLLPQFYGKGSPMVPYNLAEHIVTEKKLNPSHKYLVKMKFVCPLQDFITEEIVGAISVAQAKRLELDH